MSTMYNKRNKKNREHSLRIGSIFEWICRGVDIFNFFGISILTITNYVRNNLAETWWLVLLAIVLAIVLHIAHRLCVKYGRDITAYALNLFAKKAPYRLEKWESTYEYLSETEMQFNAHFDVVACQTGVDHIRVRYNWSGASEVSPIKLQPIRGGQFHTKCIVPDGSEFGYAFYKVLSDTKNNKGDKPMKLGVAIKGLKDTEKKASPHLLTNINVPTDRLIMTVILPSNISPENIEYLEYIHATDDYHWHKYVTEDNPDLVKAELTSDNKKKIVWEICNPVVGGKYVIKWHPQIT